MRQTGPEEKGNSGKAAAGKSRMQGFDILRCIAMMMVVVLHFLGKGELLEDVSAPVWSPVGTAAWVLESFCIVAVNVYMLISGYFLCTSSFRLSRLLQLYLQVWFYSVGVGLFAVVFRILPAEEVDIHYFLSLLFPVSMGHYWFMTAYLVLYMLLPLVAIAVEHMTKKQLRLLLAMLLCLFCVLKSVLPVRLEEDGRGYNFLWYLCVFLIAAYIRKFGVVFLEDKRRCACLYVGGCLAVLAELLALCRVHLSTGSLGLILKVSFEYNHVFALSAALGLFGLFLEKPAGGGSDGGGRIGGLAVKAAPYVLGVYLLHENLGVRYAWQRWFGAGRIQTVPQLLLGTAAAVACIFITGVIVDWIRSCIMRGVHGLLRHLKCWQKIAAGIASVDESFKK